MTSLYYLKVQSLIESINSLYILQIKTSGKIDFAFFVGTYITLLTVPPKISEWLLSFDLAGVYTQFFKFHSHLVILPQIWYQVEHSFTCISSLVLLGRYFHTPPPAHTHTHTHTPTLKSFNGDFSALIMLLLLTSNSAGRLSNFSW